MAFEQAAPIRGQLSVTANDTTAIGQFAPERILVLVEKFCDAHGRDRKSGMRPDDAGLGIVTEQDEERLFVTMRVQIQVLADRSLLVGA